MTPVPEGLAEEEPMARPSPPLIMIRSGWTRPVTARPYFGSLSVDRVAAGDDTAGLGHLVRAALKDAGHRFAREVPREARHVQGQEDSAPHGVDVAHRVGGRDHPVEIRVVHDGREEVHRLDDRLLVVQSIDGGVVAPLQPDQEVRVPVRADVRKNLVEVRRTQLGRSAGAGRILGEPDGFAGLLIGFRCPHILSMVLAGAARVADWARAPRISGAGRA